MAKPINEAPPPAPIPEYSSTPPAELVEALQPDEAGRGLSMAAEDNLIPLIYVLQSNSPQVLKRNPQYIEGAEAGCFWLRNATRPIVEGLPGLVVQPCVFIHEWLEWKPRDSGGGFIGRHAGAKVPAGAVEVEHANNPNRKRWMLPNGNEVVETRSYIMRVFTQEGVMPYMMSFSSTGHTTAKQWMSLMTPHHPHPAYVRKYRLRTRERTNAAGTWFGVDVAVALDINNGGWVTLAEREAGRLLSNAFETGERRAETPPAPSGSEAHPPMDDDIPF